MLSMLVKLLAAQSAGQAARVMAIRLASLVGAFLLAVIALFYLLAAGHDLLSQRMPDWAASLVVAGVLLALAGGIALAGQIAARRQRRRSMLTAAAAPALAAAPGLLSLIGRHPRQLVVLAIVAGALFELSRSKK